MHKFLHIVAAGLVLLPPAATGLHVANEGAADTSLEAAVAMNIFEDPTVPPTVAPTAAPTAAAELAATVAPTVAPTTAPTEAATEAATEEATTDDATTEAATTEEATTEATTMIPEELVKDIVKRAAEGAMASDASESSASDAKFCPNITSLYRTSSCPSKGWMEALLHADPAAKTFVDVGCNTGSDAIDWFEMWGARSGIALQWRKELQKNFGQWEGACSQNLDEDAPVVEHPGKLSPGSPTVICVEPMPSNFRILSNLSSLADPATGSFHVLQAAVSDSAGSVEFPDASDGTENQGIEVNHNHATVSVNKTTVDDILTKYQLTDVDVLTVDTEGHDPSALKGADGLLKRGGARLLVFEVHQDIEGSAWEQTVLLDEIERFDSYGYDCYFAGNNGLFSKVTGCWTAETEKKFHPIGWSNIACVKRDDVWHGVLESLNKGID